jgi:hypothetical protein
VDGLGPAAPEGWVVRPVPAIRAGKDYTCPNCGNRIATGVGHVVAWPDHLPDLRRHWHRHCWRIAAGAGRLW